MIFEIMNLPVIVVEKKGFANDIFVAIETRNEKNVIFGISPKKQNMAFVQHLVGNNAQHN